MSLNPSEVILLVEDEPSLLRLTQLILEKSGYKVLAAGSKAEAETLWAEHKEEIALLLTDLIMCDEKAGIQLADQLRRERPELKVIVSSGYNVSLAGVNDGSPRCFGFIQKPYSFKELARLVRTHLDPGL